MRLDDDTVLDAIAGAHAGATGWYRVNCPNCEEETGKPDLKQSFGLNANSGGYHCFAPETMVLTWDGYKAIDCLEGLTVRVPTVGPTGASAWVDAEFSHFGEQQVVEIVLSRNRVEKTIRATADHRWYVKSDTRKGGKYRIVTTAELIKGHRLRPVHLPHSGTLAPSPWGIAHGFTFGDGTLLGGTKGARAFLWGEKDAAVAKFFPLSQSAPAKTAEGVLGTRIDGLPKFFKRFPPIEESSSYLYGWLAGYFAADGCVEETGCPMLSSASRSNLEFVERVCIRLGIFTYAIRTQTRTGLGKEPSELHHLTLSRSSLSREFFIIAEHRARWAANNDVTERPGWIVKSVSTTSELTDGFCATVPDTHCFVLEGNILTGNCFKCEAKGYLDELPADIYFDKVTKPEEAEDGPPEIDPPWGWAQIWRGDGYTALSLQGARDYLHGRGLSEDIWKGANIGVAAGGYYDGRIVVPIPTADGVWRGWVARDWTGYAERNYLYPKGMRRGEILFNSAALLRETSEPVMIVEGVLDALPYWPNAVACLGKPALANGKHLQLMLEAKRPIAVCLDGDAWREGWALGERLKFEGKQSGSVRLPAGSDPNDIDRSWLINKARECVSTGE